MIINREFARASHETFTIKPIAKLLDKYVLDGVGWADPFAGWNSKAQYTNDHNPQRKTTYHLEAEEFCKLNELSNLKGVLFDPPYSYRQVSEHYKLVGMKATQKDTSYNFYNRVMEAIYKKIIQNGYAISFGWNSNGFGKQRGFKIIEILIVAHGMHHNDTIVTVEQKL